MDTRPKYCDAGVQPTVITLTPKKKSPITIAMSESETDCEELNHDLSAITYSPPQESSES